MAIRLANNALDERDRSIASMKDAIRKEKDAEAIAHKALQERNDAVENEKQSKIIANKAVAENE